MALRAFDSFYHGSPITLPQANTGHFVYWYHGSPVLPIALSAATQLVGLQMRARIVVPTVRTLEMRAHILFTPPDLQMRARILRQQGWPIPDPFDPGVEGFTDTRLLMRGLITAVGTRGNQSMSMRGRLFRGSAGKTLSMGAFIVSGQTLQMRANIVPRIFSTEVEMLYRVESESSTQAVMVFYTKGANFIPQLSMGARIVKTFEADVTHHFIVAPGQNGSPIITFDFTGSTLQLQNMSIGARVVRS